MRPPRILLLLLLLSACAFDPPAIAPPAPDAGPTDMSSWDLEATDTPGDLPAPSVDTPPDLPADVPGDLATDLTVDAQEDIGADTPADLMMDETPDEMEPAVRLEMCDGEEVDVLSDPRHCGQCGVGCDPKFGACEQGTCGCTEPDYKACGGERRCEDTANDANHCGQCGFSCGEGARCVGQQCVCRPGLTLCAGTCVDTGSNPAHCGECDKSCEGNACRGGSCKGNDQCEFGEGRCAQPGGYACLSRFGERNDLYCRRNLEFGCGSTCGGTQLCIDPGLLSPRGCYPYRLGRGCTSCPCDDCGEDERCEEAFDVVLCYTT